MVVNKNEKYKKTLWKQQKKKRRKINNIGLMLFNA